MYLSPQVLGSLSSAAVSIAKSIPAAHLAKFGLVRGTALAPLPLAGAFAVGAAVTALAVPSARRWLFDQTRGLYCKAKEGMQEAPIIGADDGSEQQAESVNDAVHVEA